MRRWIRGTNVPESWIKHFGLRFLLMCFLFVLSDAGQLLDFPGSVICLDGELQIKKPKDVHQSKWQSLRFVDSSGLDMDSCQVFPDGSLLTVPDGCINHKVLLTLHPNTCNCNYLDKHGGCNYGYLMMSMQPGRRVVYISLNDSMEKTTVYQISCNDAQADSEYTPVIECNPQYMTARISRTVPGFEDEVIVTPPPASTWTIGINNGTLVKVSVRTANSLGYTLTSDGNYLTIRANFKAFGIKEYDSQGQKFYSGDLTLIQEWTNPKISISVKMICAKGPPACNTTHMTLSVPALAGPLQSIYIADKAVPLTTSSLQQQGITLDTRNGVQLSFALVKLQAVTSPGQIFYSLPSLTLTFIVDGLSVSMALNPGCLVPTGTASSPGMAQCTTDGFMLIEVFTSSTAPRLDLDTVTVRDRTCRPQNRTSNAVFFKFPLTSCGTTTKYVDGKIFYENEVSALWKNLPPRSISRDSELRETIRCFFNGSELEAITVDVNTLPPPVPTRNEGPLLLVINLYPDISYQIPYREDQYPIVKTLRDPIFLEVEVLNRNDPNIELVLKDCWATMSQDPMSLPQWNIVVDGCQESQDNYLTVFHPVDTNIPQATHRKYFEVKAFAFMQGGELSTNLVYFHCSAIICNINSPDSPLCTKQCLPFRSRRDELFLHRHSNLASLPGPVVLVDSEPSLRLEGERAVIKQVTIGVLPAFALVAVIGLIAVLIKLIWKSKS